MDIVTIYLITHNRKHLLERAIDSVFKQTYSNVELIIVDDASTDGTELLVAELNNKYPFKYIKNASNMGACYSRNLAIHTAQGKYITGLDDDDYFGETRIQDFMDAYQEEYAFICANITEVKDDSKHGIKRYFGLKEGEFTLEQLLHNNLVGNQVFTSKEKWLEIGGFDPEMPAFQDYDTWVRFLKKYQKALKINKHNYFLHTQHGGERISSSVERKLSGYQKFMDKHQAVMSTRHNKSMHLLYLKVSGNKVSLRQLIKLTNLSNYKTSISMLLMKINAMFFKRYL